MAKTKTNEQIFADIRERGMMTEQEMQLLLRRSNAEQRDVLDYDLVDEVGEGYGIPLTEEQGRKALAWLYKESRRRDNPFGYRCKEIIANAKPTDFTLIDFYDEGDKHYKHFIPVYCLNGMDYRVEHGKLNIVG